MPRFLYLLRHSQSADKQMGQRDLERELTPEGVKQSLVMGTWLFRQNIFPDIILSSTAERAKATAGLVADTLKLDLDKIQLQEDLYDASTRTFFQFLMQLEDQFQHILCVAHNPAISYVAEYLTKAEIGDMPPAGLTVIKFNINSWKEVGEGNGELMNYVHPQMLDN